MLGIDGVGDQPGRDTLDLVLRFAMNQSSSRRPANLYEQSIVPNPDEGPSNTTVTN